MRLGPIEIKWKGIEKTWSQLDAILRRQGAGSSVPLRTNPNQQMDAYRSWVYSCITLISDRVSTLPYSFYNKDTNEELKTSNKGFKIFTKPFRKPNEFMTFRFIKQFCQIQLDLCGMAVIYPARNKLGQVWELWPLNMNDYLKVEVDGDDWNPKVKYFFKSGLNNFIDFDINELIVINHPNPKNKYAPMSPIQAQAYASDIDNYIEIYERDFFKNSARIDFALTTDASIDQEKADELKARWMEKYGSGKFHQVAVLDSGLKPVPLNYTNKDFEFLSLSGWSKEKILATYRVPANKLGSTDANRAGSVYSDISFNRESVQPRLTLWDEELTLGVCSSFDERLEIRHQNPIPRDRLLDLQEAKAYLSGVPCKTINEIREVHRMSPVDGGDRILVSVGQSYIFLDELDKIPLKDRMGLNSGQDRDRDDEDSHVNPDGTDDRDDNPTDGRSISIENNEIKFNEFSNLIDNARPYWNEVIFNLLKDLNADEFESKLSLIFSKCISATIDTIFMKYGLEKSIDIESDTWVSDISSKAASEYSKTLFMDSKWKNKEWKGYFEEQFNSNPRLSKIVNALLKSTVNYSKWIILNKSNKEIKWVVNSNECGHKGRIKNMITKDHFELGITKIRFPGETLSFSCDCTITIND